MDKTVNQNILEMYDNFSAYIKDHTIRECAEHLYPDWEIKRITDTSLRVVAVIEGVEYTARVSKMFTKTDVQVSVWNKE